MRLWYFLLVSLPLTAQSDEGLIAHWPFENDFRDLSGHGLHGRPLRGATFEEGLVGRALKLDGRASFVSVPDHPALRFGSGELSVAFWVRIPVTGKSGVRGLIGKGEVGVKPGSWAFAIDADGTTLIFREQASKKTIPLEDGWRHIALCRRSGAYRLYVDGDARMVAFLDNLTDLSVDSPLTIGRTGSGDFAGTLLDEVRLYARALFDGEVRALFDQRRGSGKPDPAVDVAVPENLDSSGGAPEPARPAKATDEMAAARGSVAVPQRAVETRGASASSSPGDLPQTLDLARVQVLFLHGTDTAPANRRSAVFGGGVTVQAPPGKDDLVLIRYDAAEERVLLRAGGVDRDRLASVVVGGEDTLVVTGTIGAEVLFDRQRLNHAGEGDVFLAVLNTNGQPRWFATAGGPGADRGAALAIAPDGRIFVAGSYAPGAVFAQQKLKGKGLFLACYTVAGELVWVHGIEAAGNLRVAALDRATDGVFVVRGSARGSFSIGGLSANASRGFILGLAPL